LFHILYKRIPTRGLTPEIARATTAATINSVAVLEETQLYIGAKKSMTNDPILR
jgi:hypothetical protein